MKYTLIILCLFSEFALADGFDCAVGKSRSDSSPQKFTLEGNVVSKSLQVGDGKLAIKISFYDSSLFVDVRSTITNKLIYHGDNFNSANSSGELPQLNVYFQCLMRPM